MTKKVPNRTIPFDEVLPYLKEDWVRQKAADALATELAEMRGRYDIVIEKSPDGGDEAPVSGSDIPGRCRRICNHRAGA